MRYRKFILFLCLLAFGCSATQDTATQDTAIQGEGEGDVTTVESGGDVSMKLVSFDVPGMT